MFDHKQAEDTDDSILQEIIDMCETHMGGGLKKPDPIPEPEAELPPVEESAAEPSSDLEGKDLEELMAMYDSIKG